jgi:hypothetical protein
MIRSYQITAIGASHVRREMEDGTPVAPRKPGEKRDPKAKASFKRYGYGDVIRLDEATARSASVAHLKLRQAIGSKPKQEAEPFEVPADWEQRGTQAKRALAAKISGKDFKRINATDADMIIRQHLATLPVGGEASGDSEGADDGADNA